VLRCQCEYRQTWATVITSFITSRDMASASGEDVSHSSVLVSVRDVRQFHAQFLNPSKRLTKRDGIKPNVATM
jgi:hypothetical protein